MTAATVAEALAAANIQLRRYTPGTHRTACHRCDKGPRDDALAVTIHNDDDAVWVCHRCQWASGWRARGDTPVSPERWTVSRAREGTGAPAPVDARIGLDGKTRQDSTGNDLPVEERIARRKLRPVTPDDLAGRYFNQRRCALPTNDVYYTPAEWHPQERRCFPCIVSIITNIITAEPQSLHFTFLDPDGDGKAKIERPRLYLAGHRKSGGVVRLHADDEVTMGIISGEGIETCLSAALGFAPVWACLDAGNLAAFPVLPGIEGLTVLVDNDDAGRAAFEAVRERYNAAGIEVVEVSTGGKPGADLNDAVRA